MPTKTRTTTKRKTAKAQGSRAKTTKADRVSGAAKTVAQAVARSTKEKVEKKLSALDAAAKVLADAKSPMNTKELIDAMAAKCLWKSPGGQTPAATLYCSIVREIATKGNAARFKKTERGKFAANG